MKNQLEIVNILKNFHMISGFRVSIHDVEFHEIYAYPEELSPFCAAVQTDPKVRKQCLGTDAEVFEKVKQTGEVCVYRCHHGLYEAVAPIYQYGILSGYLMMGQVSPGLKEHGKQLFDAVLNATRNNITAESIVAKVKEVPEDLIEPYISIMTVIAEYVTETNRLSTGNGSLAHLIKEYISQNYASRITLEGLSKRFNCSQSLIIKTFKKEYNSTIIKTLIDIRLSEAEDRLIKSRKSLKEIADECGFSDQNYFSKVFSAKHNCSPSEYRKKMSKKI